MKQFHFYHKEHGLVHERSIVLNLPEEMIESAVAGNTPPDHLPIEGTVDRSSYKVDPVTKSVVDHQPPAPSVDHRWDSSIRQWRLTDHAAAKASAATAAMKRIAMLEGSQARAIREHTLGDPKAIERLRAIDVEIDNLRKELK